MQNEPFNKFRIFLSGSVPSPKRAEKYRRDAGAQIRIEEAVISLARTVFANQGQLVFGGHPSISPLIAMIGEEYIEEDIHTLEGDAYNEKENGYPPILMYQSRLYAHTLPPETLQMLHQGQAFIRWTNAMGGETWQSGKTGLDYPLSLGEMRGQMVSESRLDAMICVGGMEGVEKEYAAYRKANRTGPVFAFKTSGGATAIIAQEYRHHDPFLFIPDDDTTPFATDDPYAAIEAVPYLSIMGQIVDGILRDRTHKIS